MVAGIKGGQEAVNFFVGGKVAQADAPRGQRVAAVTADGKHGLGRHAVRGAGRFDRDADALLTEGLLKAGSLYAVDADIEDMRHRTCRAVEAHLGVRLQCGCKAVMQVLYVGDALGLLGQGFRQRSFQRGGQAQRGCTAAVNGCAGTAGDLRLNNQPPALVQCADAVGTVEFVGGPGTV